MYVAIDFDTGEILARDFAYQSLEVRFLNHDVVIRNEETDVTWIAPRDDYYEGTLYE